MAGRQHGVIALPVRSNDSALSSNAGRVFEGYRPEISGCPQRPISDGRPEDLARRSKILRVAENPSQQLKTPSSFCQESWSDLEAPRRQLPVKGRKLVTFGGLLSRTQARRSKILRVADNPREKNRCETEPEYSRGSRWPYVSKSEPIASRTT
jgi:hypothetical protein